MARYDIVETPAATLVRINSEKPKEGECIAAYSSRLLTSLMSRWQLMSTEEIAVSIVLAHAVQIEPSLKRLAFTTEIQTRSKLQQELMAHGSRKRTFPTNKEGGEEGSDSKKARTTSSLKCFGCGRLGHRIAECLSRQSTQESTQKTTMKKPSVTCFKCGEVGHIAPRCTKPQLVRRVQTCTIKPVDGHFSHSGEQFLFYFDSGAECSLIKESIANKFSGKRFNTLVTLLGIGRGSLYSTTQILSDVIIDNYCLEILFHIVPDIYLSFDILVGREVLSLGYSVEMSTIGIHSKRIVQ